MDTNQYRDVLQLIFAELDFDIYYMLVCKFWNNVYKQAIANRNIQMKCKNKYSECIKYIKDNSISVYSLDITGSDITNFDKFSSIRNLVAYSSGKLLPESLFSPSLDLIKLNIYGNMAIKKLPIFKKLEMLYIPECKSIENINEVLVNAKYLKLLDISGCTQITELPCLENLVALHMTSCNVLSIEILEKSKYLMLLDISDCHITKLPYLKNIEILYMRCNGVENIEILGKYKKLKSLCMYYCTDIITLPIMENIKKLIIIGCKNITNIQDILRSSKKLKYLDVTGHDKIINIPYLPELKVLRANRCSKLVNIGFLTNSNNDCKVNSKLEILHINNCISITELPLMANLLELEMDKCVNIKNIGEVLLNANKLYIQHIKI